MTCILKDHKCYRAWDTVCGHEAKTSHTIHHLKERAAERGTLWQSSLKGWERAIINQSNTGKTFVTRGNAYRLSQTQKHHLELNWSKFWGSGLLCKLRCGNPRITVHLRRVTTSTNFIWDLNDDRHTHTHTHTHTNWRQKWESATLTTIWLPCYGNTYCNVWSMRGSNHTAQVTQRLKVKAPAQCFRYPCLPLMINTDISTEKLLWVYFYIFYIFRFINLLQTPFVCVNATNELALYQMNLQWNLVWRFLGRHNDPVYVQWVTSLSLINTKLKITEANQSLCEATGWWYKLNCGPVFQEVPWSND